jgi:prepilin-type N-terminal cleavage/methylation domain-containing protein
MKKLIKKIPPYPPLLKGGRGDYRKNIDGVTLIELLVVVSIICILVLALGFEFKVWMGSYDAESEIKEMYVDMMNARANAMQKNRAYFMDLPSSNQQQYAIYEDDYDATYNTISGDGILQIGSDPNTSDNLVVQKTLKHTIVPALAGGVRRFYFNKNGESSLSDANPNTIRISTTASPDYDCITLSQTRIKMGKWNGTTSTCDIK